MGCGESVEPVQLDGRPTETLLLARHVELVDHLSLTRASRTLPIADTVTLQGSWRSDWRTDKTVQWSIPVPVRGIDFGFGRSRAPDSVTLFDGRGRKRRWEYTQEHGKGRPHSWDVSRGRLRIRLPEGQAPPNGWTLAVPKLKTLEDQLQHTLSDQAAADFAFRTVLVDEQSRHGLFLPAPSQARFSIPAASLGTASRLRTTARLLAPFVGSPDIGDGAAVSIQAACGPSSTELWTGHLTHGSPVELDVPLRSGSCATSITFSTQGGSDNDNSLDYVFFDEPTLYTPAPSPRRVLVVLIDTLRADRLGAYGYNRETSPTIDALAARGTRFDNAHAPAPWTLPSTRALLSGQAPESWTPLDHIGSRLAADGFATALLSGNTYVSRYVDMHLGWTWHEYRLFSGADRQLERMEAFLQAHSHQDTLVVLQLMEPHLPYREPDTLRSMWAGETPPGLKDSFSVTDVRRWETRGLLDDEARDWISDRYDQNVRAADDAVAKALALMGEDTLVVIAADHGEELWDHGGFEHGHALWEELMRVPLVVAGPGVPSSVVTAPVSLKDVAPTVLGLLALDDEGTTGVDLRSAMALDVDALSILRDRPLAFRDLLYRSDAVGVLVDGHRKWTSREGTEQLFDLATDPGEQAPIKVQQHADYHDYHATLAKALGREVVAGWRVALPGVGQQGGGRRARFKADLDLTHPDGLTTAFSAFDSRQRSASQSTPIQGGLRISQVPGESMSAEIFIVPARAGSDPSAPTLTVRQGGRSWGDPPEPARRHTGELRRAGPASRQVVLTPAVFPMPSDDTTGVIEIDDQARAGLEALGYLE